MDKPTQRHFKSSKDLRAYIRATTGPKVLLAFSRGKDAIGAWLALRDVFDEVVPYHMDLVPGLEFVDESVRYFECFFGCRVMRFPHPSFLRQLDQLIFQPPERCAVLEQARFHRDLDYEDITDHVRERHQLPDAFVATGVRAADSPMRRMAILKHGAAHITRKSFHAVFDWNQQQLLEAIQAAGVRLPVDYKMWGRTFDGIDFRFLAPLKRDFPRDYQRVLDWFPLADLELFRRECAAKTGNFSDWQEN